MNPGFYSDFKLLGSGTCLTDKGSYIIVKTVDSPTFEGGNFILLKESPSNFEKEKLETFFFENFDKDVVNSHIAFAWENDHGDISAFTNDGYEYIAYSVLTMNSQQFIPPDKINSEITIEPLDTDNKWKQWIQNEIDDRQPNSILESDLLLFETKRDYYREILKKADGGNFYGAFVKGKLVGSAGLL